MESAPPCARDSRRRGRRSTRRVSRRRAGDLASGVTFHRHDVTSEESARALMARVEREHARLDVLVNAAGIEIEKTVEHTSLEEWNRIFAVNVTGTFLASKHALALMRQGGRRLDHQLRLVRRLHRRPQPRRLLRDQGRGACAHARDGLRSRTGQHPRQRDLPRLRGHADAAELLRFDERGRASSRTRRGACIPCGATARPQDMANLVNWLAGDEARYATGQLWVLDGGLSAQIQQMRV